MKKTLLALAIPALALSGAAHATTIYDADGTSVSLLGQVRLALEYKEHRNLPGEEDTKFRDLGSRFGFIVKHDIGDGLYGLGELEWGNNTQAQESDFVLKNRKAYIGLGLKDVGEVTFGRVVSPFDDVGLSDYSYDYGGILDFGNGSDSQLKDNFIGRVSNTIKFLSSDFNGFSFGGTYSLQSNDNWPAHSWDDNSTLQTARVKELKSAYTLALYYDSGFGLKANAGYGHARANGGRYGAEQSGTGLDTAATGYLNKYNLDIWGVGAEYQFGAFAIAADYGQARIKDHHLDTVPPTNVYTTKNQRADLYGIGVKYNILDKSKVYAGYYFADGNGDTDNSIKRTAVVGTDYKFTPEVITYIEYANTNLSSDHKDVNKDNNFTENKAMIGMRFYF